MLIETADSSLVTKLNKFCLNLKTFDCSLVTPEDGVETLCSALDKWNGSNMLREFGNKIRLFTLPLHLGVIKQHVLKLINH